MKPLDWDQDRKTAGTSNCSTKYTQLSWGMESTTEKYITTRVIIVHWNTVFDKFLTDKVYQILLSEWNHFFTYWHIQTVMQNDVDQNHVEFLPLPCSYLFPANRPVWIYIYIYICVIPWFLYRISLILPRHAGWKHPNMRSWQATWGTFGFTAPVWANIPSEDSHTSATDCNRALFSAQQQASMSFQHWPNSNLDHQCSTNSSDQEQTKRTFGMQQWQENKDEKV